ncbi:retrovirus-related pol polyprotein from transposon TNT 1-94, partial [Tanacetum coccineum]
DSLPQKEKVLESFTLPCYINNVCFEIALADLEASVNVMPLSTYLNLGLGKLAHTKLTVELGDRTVKHPKGIVENVLVGIGKFVFPIDFIILDMPEDVKVPLILRRPFLSTAHAKIDVFKRNITLRVWDEKIIFKSVKHASSLIKRVYMLCLRELIELDLEARLMEHTLVLNRSLDPLYGDYIELNDLNVPLELRRNQVDDLMLTIEEVENMDGYRDQDMGDVIFGEPFCKASCVEARRFDGLITIHNGNDNVTYQMAQSHPRSSYTATSLEKKLTKLVKYRSSGILFSSKAHREGIGLRVADSHTGNHPEGGFTPFETIRRLLVVIGRRSHSGVEGETFEPERRSIEEVMANKGKKSSMETFAPNDKADYYSGIISITVNGKNAYELKGKFLDDLHNNAFSGTNGKDAVENIEYYLKIIDPIKLPNVDHDKLRVVVFPISLAGDIFTKGALWDYWKMGDDEIEIETDVFDYETPFYLAFNEFNYLLKVDPDLLTKNIMRFKTYEDYKDDWIYKWNKNVSWVFDKPWLDNGIWKEPKPVKHTCKPFNYKTGCSEWPTCSWREDGYCNGGNLPGAYHIGNSLHYQDLEWYEALEDSELKDEALRNKAIMEGLISDDKSGNDCWKR